MPLVSTFTVKVYVLFIALLEYLLRTVQAVNPACECIRFTGTFGKEFGTFSSPDYPRPYHENINCLLYTFIGSEDEVIEITFKVFDLQKLSTGDCSSGDFLKMFLHLEKVELNEYTPWNTILCGGLQDISHTHFSAGHALIFEFHSDHQKGNNSGFMGTFRFLSKKQFLTDGQLLSRTKCDYQFVSSNNTPSQGRFYSPRYPSSYPQNIKCAYNFHARLRERIIIMFEEVALQHGDVSCLNREDLITVFDGRDSRAPVIHVLCNEAAHLELISTGPDLYLEFISNSDGPGQGFQATFRFQPIITSLPILETPSTEPEKFRPVSGVSGRFSIAQVTEVDPLASTSISNCDHAFISDVSINGSFSSPNYPHPYPPKTVCRIEFSGRGKERVQVVFTDFRLFHPEDEDHPNKSCKAVDTVMIFVYITGQLSKIDDYCGSRIPMSVMSNGPKMLLEFQGLQSSRSARGFKAIYSFTENFGVTAGRQLPNYPCAFVMNSTESNNGTFTSPNYPGYYPRETECHYFFYGKDKERVRLHFTYFDVEGKQPCQEDSESDYIEFSNIMSRDRRYQRYCDRLKEFKIESERKFFRVTFRSNARFDATGFHATYQFGEFVDPITIKRVKNHANQISCDVMCCVVILLLLSSVKL